MKLTEVTALGIRIIGILFFIKMLGALGSWYMTIDNSLDPAISKASIFTIYGLAIILSLIAIKFPVYLAKLVVPSSIQPSQELKADGQSIQIAAFVILGIFILSKAVPTLIYNVLMIYSFMNTNVEIDKSPYYVYVFVTFVELIIGLYLTLGANGVLKLIERLRYAGVK